MPLVAFVGGGYATNDDVKAKIDKIIGYTKVVSVQYEVNNIAKMVYLDTLDGTQPVAGEFTAYVKKNMKNKVGQTRDTTKDFWGTLYKLQYFPGENKFVVSSAGPDKAFGSDDDIISGYYY
jgi:hypothetical protein